MVENRILVWRPGITSHSYSVSYDTCANAELCTSFHKGHCPKVGAVWQCQGEQSSPNRLNFLSPAGLGRCEDDLDEALLRS